MTLADILKIVESNTKICIYDIQKTENIFYGKCYEACEGQEVGDELVTLPEETMSRVVREIWNDSYNHMVIEIE